MNPYATYLGERDLVQTIAETSGRLGTLVAALGTEGVGRALAPGKWSAREILCHLADTELVFAVRLRQTLAEPHHVIQPFDQDRWAATYAPFDASGALAVFAAVRRWNLKLIESVPEGTFSKVVTHPERGEMTFRTIVETMAGHDLNHLGQMETIAGLNA
jgi:hypothetical protein